MDKIKKIPCKHELAKEKQRKILGRYISHIIGIFMCNDRGTVADFKVGREFNALIICGLRIRHGVPLADESMYRRNIELIHATTNLSYLLISSQIEIWQNGKNVGSAQRTTLKILYTSYFHHLVIAHI